MEWTGKKKKNNWTGWRCCRVSGGGLSSIGKGTHGYWSVHTISWNPFTVQTMDGKIISINYLDSDDLRFSPNTCKSSKITVDQFITIKHRRNVDVYPITVSRLRSFGLQPWCIRIYILFMQNTSLKNGNIIWLK